MDSSQAGVLRELLPNDFDFLRPSYNEQNEFLTRFLLQLALAGVQSERVLTSAVTTIASHLQLERTSTEAAWKRIATLQTSIVQLAQDKASTISDEQCYHALMRLYEARAQTADLKRSWSGDRLPPLEEMSERQTMIFDWFLKLLANSQPCKMQNVRRKQILLAAALFVATHLPSRRVNGAHFHRLRFLTMLVVDELQTENFLDQVCIPKANNTATMLTFRNKSSKRRTFKLHATLGLRTLTLLPAMMRTS